MAAGKHGSTEVTISKPTTRKELEQTAIDCLAAAFKFPANVPPHVVQAAVSIVLSPEEPKVG